MSRLKATYIKNLRVEKRNDTTGISRSCKCTKRNYSPT